MVKCPLTRGLAVSEHFPANPDKGGEAMMRLTFTFHWKQYTVSFVVIVKERSRHSTK